MLDGTRGETVSQADNGEPGTKEAEALAAALNHSAERVQTLWFSFLTFMLYLAVAIGTTTHRMLFLESPLKLPVLNIDLPLLGFYILTPIIFVVLHFYMLLNLVLLARTAKSFEEALVRAFPEDGEARETFRMRIENTLFVQLLVGGRLERKGINAKLLSLMALITLALAPVALLLMFEIKFLPYHSEKITWLHRGLLALDLALVWTLWPGYRSGWGVGLWPKKTWRLVWPAVGSAAALVYGVMVATFPDERMYMVTYWIHGLTYFVDPFWDEVSSPDALNWYALIAPVNTLDLHGEDLIDDAKLAHIIEKNEPKNESSAGAQRWVATLSLAGRDLTGADLSGADVRHVDFSGAILNRANLVSAWAEKTNFDHAQLQGASLGAELQGASLNHAQLQGASFEDAHLQGASLEDAQLQAASFSDAQLQGALLNRAQLQGALLNRAQLQGALLNGAQLQGASFVDVCVWRADARLADWEEMRVVRPDHECHWTAASFAAFKQLIAVKVAEGFFMRPLRTTTEQSLDPTKPLEGEDEMAKFWAARGRETPASEDYEKSLAGQWRKLGCATEGAPSVLHGLIARLTQLARLTRLGSNISPFRDGSDAAKALAAAFLDEAHCPGAHRLSEADRAELKKIATPAAPQAPNP